MFFFFSVMSAAALRVLRCGRVCDAHDCGITLLVAILGERAMAQRFVTAQRLRTRALRLAGSLFAPRYRTAAWRGCEPLANFWSGLEPRTWWRHEGAIAEPSRGFLVSFAGAYEVREQILKQRDLPPESRRARRLACIDFAPSHKMTVSSCGPFFALLRDRCEHFAAPEGHLELVCRAQPSRRWVGVA